MLSVLGNQTSFAIDGFQCLDRVLTEAHIEELQRLVDRGLKHTFAVSGTKGILRIPVISRLAGQPEVRQIATTLLGSTAFCVRANLYNFSSTCARSEPWHQDTALPVKDAAAVPGFGPFSLVDGVRWVRAPENFLLATVTMFLSLDGLSTDSAGLCFIAGTHQSLILDDRERMALVTELPTTFAQIHRGGALVMSPLVLHRFQPVLSSKPCRLIELTFAACELPDGLEWNERV